MVVGDPCRVVVGLHKLVGYLCGVVIVQGISIYKLVLYFCGCCIPV